MIWRDTPSDLKVNNLCRNEVPYSQPLVTPSDLALQGRLPKQESYNYQIEIILRNCNGEQYIDEITDKFRIQFATSIYNNNYFTLKLREFIGLPKCFTLQVKIRNNGILLFNKITEPYRILDNSKRCYVILSNQDWIDFSTGAAKIRINESSLYSNVSEFPNHFELEYQQGTDAYYLYHDCDYVNKFELHYGQPRAFAYPLGHVLATDIAKNKLFDIYAAYIIDEEGCKLPYSRVESTFNCIDNINNIYYGDPKILLNYVNNDPDIRYSNTQWVELEVRRQPTEIKKEITYLGRSQRVDYKPLYQIKGLVPYPEWKMQELEALFTGRTVYIDSDEFILEDGELFKKDTIRCTCSWLLDVQLFQKLIVNEFSCFDSCNILCKFFVIYGGSGKDQAYYDENGRLIGFTYDSLLNYFNSYEGVVSVTDFDTSDIECEPMAVIKVDSFGYVPSFIYYYEKTPANRIYAITTDCDEPEGLCDNFTGTCLPPFNVETRCIFDGCMPVSGVTVECKLVVVTQGTINNTDSIWEFTNLTAHRTDNDIVSIAFTATTDQLDSGQTEIDYEYIGTVSVNLRPVNPVEITTDDFSITIYPNGELYLTTVILNNTVELPLINYKINNHEQLGDHRQ